MKTIKKKKPVLFYHNACITMIWLAVFYSSVIQYVTREIPNGMLILGVAILLFYYLYKSDKPFRFREELTEESIWMILFMAYMFSIGTLFSISRASHLSQAVNTLQYLFVMVIMASLIKENGTESFHILLLVKALVLAVILILRPVYYEADRYSISKELNPNGLGMAYATGIWAACYMQQKKKFSLVLVAAIIALLGFCIFRTGSRKSLIAAGLTIALWLIFCFLPSIKDKSGLSSIFSLLAMIVLAAVIWRASTGLYSESTISNRMDQLLYETTEGNRSQMYRAGLEMLKSNPLFGIGFGGFALLYGLYSHATVIEIPVSCGIAGALIYFYTYFISIRKTYRIYRRTKGIKEYKKENLQIKMIFVLWAAILFYCTCIIHPYQFDSFIMFGVIFGETSYIERKLLSESTQHSPETFRSKYIRPSSAAMLSNGKMIGSKYIKHEKNNL